MVMGDAAGKVADGFVVAGEVKASFAGCFKSKQFGEVECVGELIGENRVGCCGHGVSEC